ncbi:MAG: GyrI-like domain-containing protein [Anaerolineaceae bacterium]|nr:GyrI-like domain-containing protein [Anaerolineaceae bacterium]
MEKIDLKKVYKDLYSPSKKEFSLIEVPPLQYLMIDGQGNPNTSQRYQQAVETLYGLTYGLKFHIKKTLAIDYTAMGLEGLWWTPDMHDFSVNNKDGWHWTAMILQPEFVTPALFAEVKDALVAKDKGPLASEARLETFTEGLSAQILYLGAYAEEGPTIAAMHQFIQDQGCELTGKHHELYLSDARRVAPEKNRTILRQPARRI